MVEMSDRERVIEFRGEDHTLVIHDAHGNWSIYRGGDCVEVPFTSLTEEEQNELCEYVHDWRAGD
jgi:hypothetical protein